MLGTVGRFLKAVGGQEDGSDDDIDADASVEELQDVLRSFQVEHQMLKSLLRDKDNELEHYRKAAENFAAQVGDEVKGPPLSALVQSDQKVGPDGKTPEDGKDDNDNAASADERISLAVRALRLERRNEE